MPLIQLASIVDSVNIQKSPST